MIVVPRTESPACPGHVGALLLSRISATGPSSPTPIPTLAAAWGAVVAPDERGQAEVAGPGPAAGSAGPPSWPRAGERPEGSAPARRAGAQPQTRTPKTPRPTRRKCAKEQGQSPIPGRWD